jgi:hypothetical protein
MHDGRLSFYQVESIPEVCGRSDRCIHFNELTPAPDNFEEETMSLGTILLIVLILMLLGVIPTWPHSRSWGYGPSGALGVVVIIIIVLLVLGKL